MDTYVYVKAVMIDWDDFVGQRPSGIYRSIFDRTVTYAPGEVTVAECDLGHTAPDPECSCGIYAVRPTLQGLLRLRRSALFPLTSAMAIIAVRPVGRAYDDGVVVRAERMLTLGRIEDWRTLVPRPLRGCNIHTLQDVLDVLDGYWIADDLARLSRLRHLLGRGCYPLERMERHWRAQICPWCLQQPEE